MSVLVGPDDSLATPVAASKVHFGARHRLTFGVFNVAL
jgi:hypothetical protein